MERSKYAAYMCVGTAIRFRESVKYDGWTHGSVVGHGMIKGSVHYLIQLEQPLYIAGRLWVHTLAVHNSKVWPADVCSAEFSVVKLSDNSEEV